MTRRLSLGYVLLGCIFFCAEDTECITCLNCKNIRDLGECRNVAVCKDDETCYIEKVLSSQTFRPVYITGCKQLEYCHLESCDKQAYGDGNSRKRAPGEELTLCSECCYDDNCNTEGCGYKYHKNNSTKCFSCPEVYEGGPPCLDIVDCDLNVFECSVTVRHPSVHQGAYELGCNYKRQACNLLINLGFGQKDTNVICCDTTLCNASPYSRKINKTAIASSPCPTGIVRQTTTPVPVTGLCAFDEGSLCFWTQVSTDDFDWTFQSGPTQSTETGPSVDHTLGNAQGRYLYIEASSPHDPGNFARLESPVLTSGKKLCLSLWYYMYGDGIGNLTILMQRDQNFKTETVLLNNSGDQGPKWCPAVVEIPASTVTYDYKLVIQGDVGPSFHGDIAIDDVLISETKCTVTACKKHSASIVG